MEKRLNTQTETYIIHFKDSIKKKIAELDFSEKEKVNDLLEYVFEYQRLTFSKDDFAKRKRIQNTIPVENRCNAMKSSNERCTRRRKDDSEFCGTHTKNTPHGEFTTSECTPCAKKIVEVIAKEINGIVYYVDESNNIYRTEDILNEKENPQIIAKMQVAPNGSPFIRDFLI
jgi:hypothetical protein